ncbi:MAG TPA: ABC transporter ATP-binding protein [Ktedonobacteraceae bacterium]|nr:ABC transporter ATP-binding protein [Ktedonobacteraceae bacterium]
MRIPVRRYLLLLQAYLKPQWLQALFLALALLADIGLQLLNPQIVRYFIDTTLAHGASLSLLFAALAFIVVAIATQGIAITISYLSTNIAWTATNLLRTDLIAHCLSLDISFHKERTPGEMIERIDGDVDNLSNFFSQFILNLILNVLLLFAILVLFFTINWLVGVVMTLYSAVAMLVLMYLRRWVIPAWKAERGQSAIFYGFLGERLGGTEDIRGNGATAYVMRRFYLLVRHWFPIRRRAAMMGEMTWIVALFLFVCGSALVLATGTYLWSLGLLTIGTIYLLFSYTDLLSQPLQQIQTQLQDLQQAEACIQRVEELLTLKPSLVDGAEPLAHHGEAFAVSMQHVTFGYIPEEPILHDISFAIQPGRVLGVLGRTGSGKTTLARLLFRLYDIQDGEICIGGKEIRSVRLRDLRNQIGLVTQDVQLFHASLRDNLTFFKRTISDAQVLAALDEVGLTPWLHSLDEGLDTLLGSDGEGLSAGEAQLLAFCRILLSDPGFVLLDEASSRLDPLTEGLVECAISRLFQGRTALVIAHRLATIQRVDDILILEDGRAIEYGSRVELLNDPESRFSGLLRTGLEEVEVVA